MAIKWKDDTSYSRLDEGERVPRTWTACVGRLIITITRHRNHDPSAWILRCHELGFDYELQAKEIDAAKSEAIRKIHDTLAADMVALGKVAR